MLINRETDRQTDRQTSSQFDQFESRQTAKKTVKNADLTRFVLSMNDKREFLCFRTGCDMQGQSNGYTDLDESQLHCHTKDKARLQNVRTD